MIFAAGFATGVLAVIGWALISISAEGN